MEIGVFIPIGNNGWLISTTSPQYRPSFELNRRIVRRWQRAGVTIVDPATTWLDADVELAPDVVLRPNVQLHGRTTVGEGAEIGPDTTLTDVTVGPRAKVVRTHGNGAILGEGAEVGARRWSYQT